MIQNVFVLLLLSLFAVLSTFLVTIGAQMYRTTVDSSEKNNNIRITSAVVRSAIWAEDKGIVSAEPVVDENGNQYPALSMPIIAKDGWEYVKRLYAYDGYLLESFTLASMGFDPEYGEKLCELDRFEPRFDGNVLIIEIETTDHITSTIQMVLRAGGAAQ